MQKLFIIGYKKQSLTSLKERKKPGKEYSVTRLKGLGKNVWNKTDIPGYITTERESWD
jgi:hypothetical protein